MNQAHGLCFRVGYTYQPSLCIKIISAGIGEGHGIGTVRIPYQQTVLHIPADTGIFSIGVLRSLCQDQLSARHGAVYTVFQCTLIYKAYRRVRCRIKIHNTVTLLQTHLVIMIPAITQSALFICQAGSIPHVQIYRVCPCDGKSRYLIREVTTAHVDRVSVQAGHLHISPVASVNMAFYGHDMYLYTGVFSLQHCYQGFYQLVINVLFVFFILFCSGKGGYISSIINISRFQCRKGQGLSVMDHY